MIDTFLMYLVFYLALTLFPSLFLFLSLLEIEIEKHQISEEAIQTLLNSIPFPLNLINLNPKINPFLSIPSKSTLDHLQKASLYTSKLKVRFFFSITLLGLVGYILEVVRANSIDRRIISAFLIFVSVLMLLSAWRTSRRLLNIDLDIRDGV